MEPVRRPSPSVVRRPGGRSARVNAAILAAASELLGEVGYAALTMELVAVRADVHRATLYRRWSNKQSLVAEALREQAEQAIPMPDTGFVDEDLQLLVLSIVQALAGPGEATLRTLVGEAARAPEVKRAGRAFWEYRLLLAASLVRRGVERGELPDDVDPDAFVEEMVAPIFFRLLVTGAPIGDEFALERVHRQLALARR